MTDRLQGAREIVNVDVVAGGKVRRGAPDRPTVLEDRRARATSRTRNLVAARDRLPGAQAVGCGPDGFALGEIAQRNDDVVLRMQAQRIEVWVRVEGCGHSEHEAFRGIGCATADGNRCQFGYNRSRFRQCVKTWARRQSRMDWSLVTVFDVPQRPEQTTPNQ